MRGVFVELPVFERRRADYFDELAFAQLQAMLMKDPVAGDLIRDTGGLRKLRFADRRRGRLDCPTAQGAQGDDQVRARIKE